MYTRLKVHVQNVEYMYTCTCVYRTCLVVMRSTPLLMDRRPFLVSHIASADYVLPRPLDLGDDHIRNRGNQDEKMGGAFWYQAMPEGEGWGVSGRGY